MNPGECSIKGHFLEHRGRRLFCLLLEPAFVQAHSAILFLPPFAEEMNKSRRIVACQARELAACGHRVMLLDPTGCGDAGGDFHDASWQVWLQDAIFAANYLVAQGNVPLSLWGLRLGALLACELTRAPLDIRSLMLWQPVLNGEQQIDQFLRLRTVAAAVNNTATFDRKALWNELRAGRSLEVAGYELSSAMALEVAKVRLIDLRPACQIVHWLEIGAEPQGSMSPPSESVIAQWLEQGVQVARRYVQGDPFWRVIDAAINPSLQRCTTDAFAQL
jgi:exosortase A-associated hydrolase 2